MEQATRNKLRNVVTQCRKLLEESITQQLEGQFGIRGGKNDAVQIEDEARMTHLSDEDQQYRRDLLDHFEHIKARSFKSKDALDQLIREIAFTHLNRLCAYKMMEARDVYVGGQRFREAVGRGINSNGFKFYLADHPDDERLFNTGEQELAYRNFLDWLGGLLSEEIGVLFNPNDPANRLYPRQNTLNELIGLLNGDDIKLDEKELKETWPTIWELDETIGWVYQYFTPKELRDKARKESQAPRNSYELAFRNQFFTPRYVVEFLTDNTLGRIWHEMRKGDTALKQQCRYMVCRPNEVFLDEGQEPPETPESQGDLSQEELLKQPVQIPHRPKKDPRELKILDPACGSGHFLLYCFDLLLTIYEEAYNDPDLGPALQKDYTNLDDLRRDVPRLILAHNLHGIDIDLRCTQIAALALWLRCQRTYQETGLKKDRPPITRSNLVCAEPMPGEEGLLDEFLKTLHEDRLEQLIRRVMDVPEDKTVRTTPEMADRLCELVHLVWDKMKLAGEAGSLLKIEEEIQEAIRTGQEEWEEQQPLFRVTQYALTEEPQEKYIRVVPGEGVSFWERAEALVMAALDDFAKYAANGRKLLRKLFVDDAMRGFAFVDLCRQPFDAVLMNPPFGNISTVAKDYVFKLYPVSKNDLLSAFVERGLKLVNETGFLGAITSRTGFFLSSFQEWREDIVLAKTRPTIFADLGSGVLDSAMVETAAFCLQKCVSSCTDSIFLRLLNDETKSVSLKRIRAQFGEGSLPAEAFLLDASALAALEGTPFAYWISPSVREMYRRLPRFESEELGRTTRCGLGTTDNFRFLRANWEIHNNDEWVTYYDGGVFSPFYDEFPLVVWWKDGGKEIKAFIETKFGSASRKVQGEDHYFRQGFVFPRRTKGLSPKVLSEGGIFSNAGQAGFVSPADLLWSVAVLASSACTYLVSLSQGSVDGAQFEVGLIKRLPWPEVSKKKTTDELSSLTKRICELKQELASADETSLLFSTIPLAHYRTKTLNDSIRSVQQRRHKCEQQVQEDHGRINEITFDLYEFSPDDKGLANAHSHWMDSNTDTEDEQDRSNSLDEEQLVSSLISYGAGCLMGRWDIRFATGDIDLPKLPDPVSRHPKSSIGALTPAPIASTDHPLRIDWDGILVDDPGHQDDIVRRVREVLEVIWKERSDAIEKEACEILGVKTMRDYFRKPGKGGFWDDHIKRYSKSRRKAPIYWLLQSSKKNYALWLYYHRLDKDMLFKALLNYVEPKTQREDNRLAELRSQKFTAGDSAKEAKKLDRGIEKQEDLLSELRDFEEKLRKVADLHLVPDLNDGVVLNIAPLHELVPWKEAKKYWNELMDGKYEWSSIGKQLREKGLVK